MYYFDIGSSIIKLYKDDEELEMIEEKSIAFKKGFLNEKICEETINNFINFISQVKEKYDLNIKNTEIFATGIWRNIAEKQLLTIKDKFNNLNLKFNVISHKEENDYLEKAMQGNYIIPSDLNLIHGVIKSK